MARIQPKIKCLSLLFLSFLMSGCTTAIEQNSAPIISINHQVDGLKVSITGSVNDTDGSVSEFYIHWGDNSSSVPGPDLQNFEISHTYSMPETYKITVSAIDNKGDTASQSIVLNLDYKETNLTGIKETLFKKSENEYLILTVNLHCYQENDQPTKFRLLTDLIGKMDVDFIALQECAQNKSTRLAGGIIREDNMALIISKQLSERYKTAYFFNWNWAHYGWNVWEEGIAVLSKYPIIASDQRYISTNTSTGSISSRKVIFSALQTPHGIFNIFSAHTHWRTSIADEEQNNQIKNIKSMVAEKEMTSPEALSMVCGDFNGNPTSDYPWSEGYHSMMKYNDYLDSYLEIYPNANSIPAESQHHTIWGDLPGRIDYIFLKKNPLLKVIDSQIIFKENLVGKISDHYGILTKISVSR